MRAPDTERCNLPGSEAQPGAVQDDSRHPAGQPPRCADHAEPDRKDLYRTNSEATKLAIARALKGEPTVDELIANRRTVKHYALEDVVEY